MQPISGTAPRAVYTPQDFLRGALNAVSGLSVGPGAHLIPTQQQQANAMQGLPQPQQGFFGRVFFPGTGQYASGGTGNMGGLRAQGPQGFLGQLGQAMGLAPIRGQGFGQGALNSLGNILKIVGQLNPMAALSTLARLIANRKEQAAQMNGPTMGLNPTGSSGIGPLGGPAIGVPTNTLPGIGLAGNVNTTPAGNATAIGQSIMDNALTHADRVGAGGIDMLGGMNLGGGSLGGNLGSLGGGAFGSMGGGWNNAGALSGAMGGGWGGFGAGLGGSFGGAATSQASNRAAK